MSRPGKMIWKFEVTEWKRLIWKNIKGKNRFYARYSTVANFPQRGIQNPRLSWIPLVHRAITGIYLPNLLSFLSSGGVDNLLFSVSGLLSFSASWYRALLFPYSLSYDACFQDLTETHNEWLPVVRLSWLPFRWKEQEVILNTPGCRLSCKNKSIKRKSCFLWIITCFHIKFMPWIPLEWSFMPLFTFSLFLPKTFVKYKSSRFFYRQTRSFSSPKVRL